MKTKLVSPSFLVLHNLPLKDYLYIVLDTQSRALRKTIKIHPFTLGGDWTFRHLPEFLVIDSIEGLNDSIGDSP